MAVVVHDHHCHPAPLAHDHLSALGEELRADGLGQLAAIDSLLHGLEIERVAAVAVVGVAVSEQSRRDGQVAVVALLLRLF